jgi:predicted GIY-YIG superfamily endonuclease
LYLQYSSLLKKNISNNKKKGNNTSKNIRKTGQEPPRYTQTELHENMNMLKEQELMEERERNTRIHIKYDNTVPGYVYVIYGDGRQNLRWYVGSTRDLERRIKEHTRKDYFQRGYLYGLISYEQASTAYSVEQIFHGYPYKWDKEVLKWLVKSFGGQWDEKGLR